MSGQVLENSSNIVSTPCGQCVSFFYDLRYIEIFEIICYQFFNCEKRVLWRRRNNLELDFYFDRDMAQKKLKRFQFSRMFRNYDLMRGTWNFIFKSTYF